MRILGFLLCFAVFSIGFSEMAMAKKSGGMAWGGSSKIGSAKEFIPYFGEEQIRHRGLWDNDEWTPESWLREEDDDKRIMRDFYEYGIVTKQYQNSKNIHVLEVGDTFVQLSGLDQRRVLQFVDYVYQITEGHKNGMFYVYLKGVKDEPMGLYNKYGFQNY